MHISIVIILMVFCLIMGTLTGMMIVSRFVDSSVRSELDSERNLRIQYMDYYMVLNEWMAENQSGKSIVDYFEKRNITKIAIYGMTELGCRLYSDLINSNVEVICAIDRGSFCCPVPELKLINTKDIMREPKVCEVQMVVVTPFFSFQAIKKELQNDLSCQICSIKDIISEL